MYEKYFEQMIKSIYVNFHFDQRNNKILKIFTIINYTLNTKISNVSLFIFSLFVSSLFKITKKFTCITDENATTDDPLSESFFLSLFVLFGHVLATPMFLYFFILPLLFASIYYSLCFTLIIHDCFLFIYRCILMSSI